MTFLETIFARLEKTADKPVVQEVRDGQIVAVTGAALLSLVAQARLFLVTRGLNKGDRCALLDDLTLIHTPGHFDGFQVLHWPRGAEGKGVLFSGDQPQVCMDTRWVSFMYSYPNYIPLGARAVEQIVARLEPCAFDRIHGAFPRRSVVADAKNVVRRSAERFIQAGTGAP